jgi:hypothetical protein
MAHQWRFFRAGGFDQVRIDTGADIAHLPELDPKLWVALSSPVEGLEFDPHTLALLDDDHDGRIRVPEVMAAAKWTASMLKNPDDLVRPASADPLLPLEAINTQTEEGKHLLSSAKQVLVNLGKADATSISPDDVADTAKMFAKTLFNGDGVITPETAEQNVELADALRDIQLCVGTTKDVSGLDGVDQPRLDLFFKELDEYLAWSHKADSKFDLAAFESFRLIREKAEDYFARCALAAMDNRSVPFLNPAEATYSALALTELSVDNVPLGQLPLAQIEPHRPLPLKDGLNPAWEQAIAKFRDQCVVPTFGPRIELSSSEWRKLSEGMAGAQAWYALKPTGSVEKLGLARLQALADPKVKAGIDALMAKDKALEPELKAITSVDKLAHYLRDLSRFLNNYVSFTDFYTHREKAIFQAGTLYLDGRSCDLCLKVLDPARHGVLASLSMAYLAYCEVTHKSTQQKMEIVAAFTQGDSDFLVVGRNGIFYDRLGQDWDATIVKIIDQPISVRQAFWAPYRKVAKFVEDQINKVAGAKDQEAHAEMTKAVSGATTNIVEAPVAGSPITANGAPTPTDSSKKTVAALPPPPPPPPPTPAFDIGKFAGVFAAIGLAVGMIGSALAAVFTGFLGLKVWQMPLVIAGAMLVVSGPSMLLAAMKLRKRNLGPLLDACGWAINTHALINIPFGASLTQEATLPPGSSRSYVDPYAIARRPWKTILFALALIGLGIWAWSEGYVAKFIASWKH